MKNKMSKSIKKHIRTEKARIRREAFSVKEEKDKINKLYQSLTKKDDNKVAGSTKNKD